ncbi:MAG TPA: hypothetical protein ENN78_02385, partial [Candidatus Omnitrophica bacterium]|nr:hypothetical protein [Candidatus Omnitrophota bacterium]
MAIMIKNMKAKLIKPSFLALMFVFLIRADVLVYGSWYDFDMRHPDCVLSPLGVSFTGTPPHCGLSLPGVGLTSTPDFEPPDCGLSLPGVGFTGTLPFGLTPRVPDSTYSVQEWDLCLEGVGGWSSDLLKREDGSIAEFRLSNGDLSFIIKLDKEDNLDTVEFTTGSGSSLVLNQEGLQSAALGLGDITLVRNFSDNSFGIIAGDFFQLHIGPEGPRLSINMSGLLVDSQNPSSLWVDLQLDGDGPKIVGVRAALGDVDVTIGEGGSFTIKGRDFTLTANQITAKLGRYLGIDAADIKITPED